ncbi:adenine phosphoribosyltransferase [bacterium]
MNDLKSTIRNVPDFPKKGIGFKDITTLLKEPDAFREAVQKMCEPFRDKKLDGIAGIESRGFIFGGAMAVALGVGFIPIRKPGKLPAETMKEEYTLEYGTDAVEIHRDAVSKDAHILIVDDLLATGGTAAAAIRLIRKLGGVVAGTVFLIELGFLNGREQLGDVDIHVLIQYQEE